MCVSGAMTWGERRGCMCVGGLRSGEEVSWIKIPLSCTAPVARVTDTMPTLGADVDNYCDNTDH